MEADSIFSNDLDEFITNDGVKKKKRKIYKCEHGRNKHNCKICNPKRYCEHNRVKWDCKECGGDRICEHKRHKRTYYTITNNNFCS